MKILLLIPPASLETSYGKLKDFSNPQPSIGLAYMAAILQDGGFDVVIIDAYVSQLGLEEIIDIIKQEAPAIVGISVLTTAADVVRQITKQIRKLLPQIKIVMGNIHASLFVDKLLAEDQADFIVHQEGEYTMLELAQALRDNLPVENIQGISYSDNSGTIRHTPLRPFITNLDILPFPAWNLFSLNKYRTDPRTQLIPGKTEIQVLATRGCPNVCAFCSSSTNKSLGHKYRMRQPEKFVDELKYLNNKYNAQAFSFMDLAFPLVKSHGLAVCQEIIQRGLSNEISWVTELRVKPLDLEILTAMKKAGCRRVCFGIESGTDRILKILRKNFTTADVSRAVSLAKKAGLEVDGMFMIGLPSETIQDINRTINFAVSLKVRYAIFNIFVPYPGCEFYNTLSQQGKIKFKQWSDFTSYPTYSGGQPVYVPDGLTQNKLMALQKKAMRKFYLRPAFVWSELKNLKLSKLKQYWHGLSALLSARHNL